MKSYMSRPEAAEEFGMSQREMFRHVDDIREQIGRRYGEYAVIGRGKTTRVSTVVLVDFLKHKNFIGTAFEQPFNEQEARRYL